LNVPAMANDDPLLHALARPIQVSVNEIRQRTTVIMAWLVEQLSMRSAANVSQQILRKTEVEKSVSKPLKAWIILSRNVA